MKTALCLLTYLTLLSLIGCAPLTPDLPFAWTGEEELLGQARGTLQLAGNLLRPQPETRRYEPVAHAGVNPFGINVFLEQEVEPRKREQAVHMIAEAGFHWLRQEFPWEDIEIHGKGDFEDRRHEPHRSAWEKYDHIVGLAEQYDLQVIARLSNPPSWSRADGDAGGTTAPPDDYEDFGDYVHAVASRYKGHIPAYQIWNEPNIYPEWGEQAADPEAYTQLLCLAYRRVKEADPQAIVVSGALAQTIEFSGRDLSDLVFLQRMYDAGAGDCFDVLAVNTYMLWSGPTDRRLRPLQINYSRPLYLRDLMVVNGDEDKPIWISEMNANAVPNDPSIQNVGRYGQVTLEQQARYAPLAYQRAMEEWPWTGVINFWFFKRATDMEQNQSWYYFRMVEPDFTPLPVYETMRSYITGLTPTLYPGTHQENHWALSYQGVWQHKASEEAVLGAYEQATEPGAQLAFTFEGSSLSLTPGSATGEISVQIDDRPPRSVSLQGQPVRLFSAWGQQCHRVQLTLEEGVAEIDSITVQGPERQRRTLVAGLVVLSILGLATPFLIRRRSQGSPDR